MNYKINTRTKIIATIGPASLNEVILEKMILAGMDVCRINGSHGDHVLMQKAITTIRELNAKLKSHVAILFDLQGPKIRIGDLEEKDIVLKNGDELLLNHREVPGSSKEVFIKYPNFFNDVNVGDMVLVDDGKIELQVIEILADERVKTKVINGGPLSSRKGVNLPNTIISLPSLTAKDRKDLEFALANEV